MPCLLEAINKILIKLLKILIFCDGIYSFLHELTYFIFHINWCVNALFLSTVIFSFRLKICRNINLSSKYQGVYDVYLEMKFHICLKTIGIGYVFYYLLTIETPLQYFSTYSHIQEKMKVTMSVN